MTYFIQSLNKLSPELAHSHSDLAIKIYGLVREADIEGAMDLLQEMRETAWQDGYSEGYKDGSL